MEASPPSFGVVTVGDSLLAAHARAFRCIPLFVDCCLVEWKGVYTRIVGRFYALSSSLCKPHKRHAL